MGIIFLESHNHFHILPQTLASFLSSSQLLLPFSKGNFIIMRFKWEIFTVVCTCSFKNLTFVNHQFTQWLFHNNVLSCRLQWAMSIIKHELMFESCAQPFSSTLLHKTFGRARIRRDPPYF